MPSLLNWITSLKLLVLTVSTLMFSVLSVSANNAAYSPWHGKNSSIVLDAYAYTPIQWNKLRSNKKLVGFINKASDGRVEPWRCKGNATKQKLCTVIWRRYKAEHELFLTRRTLAKAIGLKWGSYHLARPGNPVEQALHYIQYADPEPEDLIALDIEHNDPEKWMSLKDAEVFARVIYKKLGRYPLLYTNHDTAKYIARNRDRYKLLSRLNLWYARYKNRIPGVFPLGNWPEYTMWQFGSMHNCNRRSCLYRVRGTDSTIDVNVATVRPEKLRKQWPFDKLTAKVRPVKKPAANVPLLVAYAPETAKSNAQAAIARLMAPYFKSDTELDEEAKALAVVVPRAIEVKALQLVARLVAKSIDEQSVSSLAKASAVKAIVVEQPAFRFLDTAPRYERALPVEKKWKNSDMVLQSLQR